MDPNSPSTSQWNALLQRHEAALKALEESNKRVAVLTDKVAFLSEQVNEIYEAGHLIHRPSVGRKRSYLSRLSTETQVEALKFLNREELDHIQDSCKQLDSVIGRFGEEKLARRVVGRVWVYSVSPIQVNCIT